MTFIVHQAASYRAPLCNTKKSILSCYGTNPSIIVDAFQAATAFTTSTTIITSTATTADSASVSFEPVLNVPALGTFLFISIIFSWLILRTNQVEDAVQERQRALEKVRQLKVKELDSSSSTIEDRSENNNNSKTELEQSLAQFQKAVEREEELRNVLPGISSVRIVPPSASNADEKEARAMAKQFLGKEYDIGTLEEKTKNDDDTTNSPTGKLSNGAIAVLAIIFFVQLALLAFLSIDPMSSSTM